MEQYYRIPIQPFPKIRYGKMSTIRTDRWKPEKCEDLLELNYVITGNLVFRQDSLQDAIPQDTFFSVFRSKPYEYTFQELPYQEYTLGMNLFAPAVLVDEKDVAAMRYTSTEAIIPRTITDPDLCRQIYPLLTAIGSHLRDSPDPVRYLMVTSRQYELLALLTRYSLQRARRRCVMSSNRPNPHCRRACVFVQEHLTEKIRVADVAKYTGIGYRRLSVLFRAHMGVTLVDYINQEKIQRVKQLILTEGTTLEVAGAAVGIENPKYLSTLFHKHTGMTIRQYKQMCR